jgi:MFS family permease
MKLMRVNKVAAVVISKGVGFLGRQQRDWKVTVIRSSVAGFFNQMIFPYQSIYIVALGATATQLGIVNSAGMTGAGLLSPFVGWLIDRIGVKKIYLIGIGLLAVCYLTYAVAWSWIVIIFAMLAYWLGFATSMHSCATVCANSLVNEDRATGMSFCETLAAGLLGIAGPILGALLVTAFGGVKVRGIRPLFFFAFVATVATFILVLSQLSKRTWRGESDSESSLFRGFSQLFQQGHNLKRWLVISSIGFLPTGMVFPFSQLFAHEIKGADQYTLGLMVTGFAITPLLLGIPLGRLADKIGRKKVLYLTAPFFWASNLMLILAPNPGFLIAAGVLQGFFYVHGTVAGAMGFELVPPEQMGRWIGIMRFFRLMFAAGLAYLAGAIWDNIGPEYVFLTAMGLDILIRVPLLIGMPETLGLRRKYQE